MRLASALLAVAMAALFSTEDAFAAANTVSQLLPSYDDYTINNSVKRSLQSEPIDEADEDDTQDEERTFNLGGLENLFKPQTAEQIAEAAKKAETNKFYSKLAKSATFLRQRFPDWKRDGIEDNTIIAQLKAHGVEDNYKEIMTKYIDFRKTGVIS